MTEDPTSPGVGPRRNQPTVCTLVGTCTWLLACNPSSPIDVEIPNDGTVKCTGVDRASPCTRVVDVTNEVVVDDSVRRAGSCDAATLTAMTTATTRLVAPSAQ